jgi:putative transcriptional regulator
MSARDWPAELRELRERLRVSQSGLALRLGISLRTLQEWEQGRRAPRGPAVALIEQALRESAPAV